MFLRSLLFVLVLLPLKSVGAEAEWYMQYMALGTGVKKLGVFYDGELGTYSVYDITKNPLRDGSILTLVQFNTEGQLSPSAMGEVELVSSEDGKTASILTKQQDEDNLLLTLALGEKDLGVVCYGHGGKESVSLPGTPRDVLNLVRVRSGEVCNKMDEVDCFLGIKSKE